MLEHLHKYSWVALAL